MKERLSWFAYIVALGTWAVLSYSSLAQYIQEGSLFARLFDGRPYVSDFVNHYNAGLLSKRALSERINIYDPKIQDTSVRKLITPVVPEAPFNLQYPPYFFVLMYPLSFFSLTGAWLLWNAISLTGIIVCLRSLCTSIYTRLQRISIYIMVLASYPTWLAVELGQTALPQFIFITAFFQTLRTRRFFLCGLVMALITIKLQYTPFFGIVGLVAGGWTFLAGLGAGMTLLLLASTLMLGTDNILAFPAAILHGETGAHVSGVNAIEMQNLRGQLALIFHSDNASGQLPALILMAIVVVALIVLWRRYASDPARQTELHFKLLASITVLLALISSVHTHSQDYILAALPCIWLWHISSLEQTGLITTDSIKRTKLLRALIIVFPIYSWLLLFLKPVTQLLLIQPLFIWAIALTMLACARLNDLYKAGARSSDASDWK